MNILTSNFLRPLQYMARSFKCLLPTDFPTKLVYFSPCVHAAPDSSPVLVAIIFDKFLYSLELGKGQSVAL